jgi:hypothetical protein
MNYAERMGSQVGRILADLGLGLANVLNGAWHDALAVLRRSPGVIHCRS